MKARKSLDEKGTKAHDDRERRAKAAEDQSASDRAPSKTYFRYPAAARRREPVRFYR